MTPPHLPVRQDSALWISELFGPTFQGEGKNLGMPCMFLRTAGCNLRCTWCDTPYTWDWSRFDRNAEVHRTPLTEIWRELSSPAYPRNLVITGGEPLLQQAPLNELLTALHREGWWTEMETAGTVTPTLAEPPKQWNVSPKLANSGNPAPQRRVDDALRALRDSGRAVWKFVVQTEADFDEIDALVRELALAPVYILPEGTDEATLAERMPTLAAATVARGYYLSPRLHITVFGNRRGV